MSSALWFSTKLKALGLNIETKANTRKYESFVESFVKRRTGQAITQIEGTTKKEKFIKWQNA